jgi:drug/metabolite transporter (DMT)-like permease
LIGAVGVFWFQPRWRLGHVSLGGLAIAFTASICWAFYGVLAKRPSAEIGSIRSFGLISFFTSLMLFPLTWAFGNLATPWQVSTHVNGVLIASAVLCITAAHILYYVAIREIGVALSQTLQLLSPLGALALSAWIFHERFTLAQGCSAAILLFGAFLATRVKPQVTASSSERV